MADWGSRMRAMIRRVSQRCQRTSEECCQLEVTDRRGGLGDAAPDDDVADDGLSQSEILHRSHSGYLI